MKPKVLHLVHSFIQGGSETQMIQLMRLLKTSGNFEIHVACLDAGGVLRSKVDELHFAEVPEFKLTNFYDRNMVDQLRRFVGHLKSRNIQIVHTHEFYSNIFGIAGARLAGIPVRIASKRETLGLRTEAQKKLELIMFRFAKAIVVNAEAVRLHLLGLGVNKNKPVVIHNGLDLDRFPKNLDTSETRRYISGLLPASLNGAAPVFVTMVANMHLDVKNYPMFLRAASRVYQSLPNAIFLLIGSGDLTESLRQMAAELGIGNNTLFLGHRDNVPDLLRISDVCVLSSKAEGFSNSILEYMACGKPAVATDVGGAREAIVEGETGFLVKSNDDQTMGDRILQLLKDRERAVYMGALGREIVESQFSCEAQLRKTENLYSCLLQNAS